MGLSADSYPKRLIEVDLPIKRISAHARREKSIRHGHISTLHIWWARRPLAACRAVICAALWPDPADPLCPKAFREKACEIIQSFAQAAVKDTNSATICSEESLGRWVGMAKAKDRLNPMKQEHMELLRFALLDFIADFSAWEASTNKCFLETARRLTQAAHEALGGMPGTRPLVVDSFAGGGSIPMEALRAGADGFAADLNPIPVLLNKVILEYIPKHGAHLAAEVRKSSEQIRQEVKRQLADLYPKDEDGATPIAYLWARTIRCEGPRCGAIVPLLRSLWLAKKGSRSVVLQLIPNPRAKRIDFQILGKQGSKWIDQDNPKAKVADLALDGTVKRGNVTCPCCGYTTPVERVRLQLAERRGGTSDAIPYCKVIATRDGQTLYRSLTGKDLSALRRAEARLARLNTAGNGLPRIQLPPDGALGLRVQKYGILEWGDLFLSRQKVQLLTYLAAVKNLRHHNTNLLPVLKLLFGLTVSKLSSFASTLCVWRNVRTCVAQTFGRQTLSMVWDFGEMNPFAGSAGDFGEAAEYLAEFIEHTVSSAGGIGTCEEADAVALPLPDDCSDLFFTDPPYYDAIPYNHLSGFFQIWLAYSGILTVSKTADRNRQAEECIVDPSMGKLPAFFEHKMTAALTEGRRISKPDALGVVVFAHKSTAGWESQLQAMLDAGWTITSSWPIDTERTGRLRANDSAALGSSVHITCRPRENLDGSLRTEAVGDWRKVLQELPRRIREWMPRLAAEGVVGADAIFSCLGPALEIFSRYSRVEKANGEEVTLPEYLEQVWAAVAKEALSLIFTGADATGFEEDARLTAMWLWTLTAGLNGNGKASNDEAEDADDEEEEGGSAKSGGRGGYVLEYDAARKIAQGLGAHLEKLANVVEVKGETARLLPAAERTRYLFGKDQEQASKGQKRKKTKQLSLGFEADLEEAEAEGGWGDKSVGAAGATVLDRLHQAMILFAASRSEALKRFLVEEAVGQDQRFWRLAQALSALYPSGSDEKRWVDGVLARKKGLGL